VSNISRFFPIVTLTLSALAANASANLTAINNALTTYANTDTWVWIPPGNWPINGLVNVASAKLAGDPTSVLVASDGTSTPAVGINITGSGAHCFGFTLNTTGATVRGFQLYNNGVTFNQCVNSTCTLVTVNAPSASGFFHYGTTNCRTEACVVNYSLADGFHHSNATVGTTNCECSNPTVVGSGDDFFAVVSYASANPICNNILIHDFVGTNQQTAGRGATVVGGNNVVYRRGSLSHCATRGIYIASDVSFTTYGVNGVTLDTISVNGTGTVIADQGDPLCAGVFFGGRAGYTVQNVTTTAITVKNNNGPLTRDAGFTSNNSFSGVTAG
jgi:hypothetical protein